MIIIPDGLRYDKKLRTGNLEVQLVSYTDVPDNWIHKRRVLYVNEFIYVTEGIIHLRVNREVFDMKKDDYIIVPAFSTISGVSPSQGTCAFYSVSFKGNTDVLNKLIEKKKQSISGNLIFVYELMKRMRSRYQSEMRKKVEMDSLFLTLAYELYDRQTDTNVNLPVQKMLDYIHEHVNTHIDISDLCREFNYSNDYISKLFRQSYGTTIKRYINQVKMTAAKQLLVTSHLTIEQVGKAVGFDDVLLFYRYFRYHEKMSPSEYRKRYR